MNTSTIQEKSKTTTTSTTTTPKTSPTKARAKKKEPSLFFLMNIFINLLVTFALSLSIYLLIANVFLTVYKLNTITSPTSMYDTATNLNYHLDLNNKNNQGQQSIEIIQNKYYDCSKNLLTLEECDLLNTYHSEYLNSLRSYLIDKGNDNFNARINQMSNLKVNTTYYIQ